MLKKLKKKSLKLDLLTSDFLVDLFQEVIWLLCIINFNPLVFMTQEENLS